MSDATTEQPVQPAAPVSGTPQPVRLSPSALAAAAKVLPAPSPFITMARAYAQTMPPVAECSQTMAGTKQAALWLAMRDMFRNTPDQLSFNSEWNAFLAVVRGARETVFHENYAFMVPDYWTLGTNEYRTFRTIMHLAMTTCIPATRKKDLATIGLGSLTKDGVTSLEQRRFVAFYA